MKPGSPCTTSELDSSDEGLPDQRTRLVARSNAQQGYFRALLHDSLNGLAAAGSSVLFEQIGLSHASCQARGGP